MERQASILASCLRVTSHGDFKYNHGKWNGKIKSWQLTACGGCSIWRSVQRLGEFPDFWCEQIVQTWCCRFSWLGNRQLCTWSFGKHQSKYRKEEKQAKKLIQHPMPAQSTSPGTLKLKQTLRTSDEVKQPDPYTATPTNHSAMFASGRETQENQIPLNDPSKQGSILILHPQEQTKQTISPQKKKTCTAHPTDPMASGSLIHTQSTHFSG